MRPVNATAEARALRVLEQRIRGLGREAHCATLVEQAGSAVNAVLVLTWSEMTMAEQAALLAIPRSSVMYRRRCLRWRGLVSGAQRASHATITPDEVETIRRLWADEAMPPRAIAEARGVSVHRVTRCLKRAGVATLPRQPRYTLKHVCALFGVDHNTVLGWIDAGWLLDTRPITGSGVAHTWTRDEIVAFVEHRASWVGWEVTQLTDAVLRATAEAARQGAGGAWWPQDEIARLVGINPNTFSLWRRDDRLFSRLPVQAWRTATWTWLTTEDQGILTGWSVRPLGLSGHAHRVVAGELRQRLIARYGGQG